MVSLSPDPLPLTPLPGTLLRVEELDAQLSIRGPTAGMPGNKRFVKRHQPERNGPRKRRLHGFARRRMELTQRVIHAPESCPECGTGLSGGWVQRTREVIELPMVPAEVVEHVFVARICPLCDKRRLPQEPLEGLAMGRRRLGVNLVSLIVTLREEGRLPVRSIQWYLQTVHQLELSVGAIIDVVHATAQRAQPVVAEMLERIRGSPVVHADETGWRQDGPTAMSGPSALPRSDTSYAVAAARVWWTRCWASPPVRARADSSAECW